MGVVPQLGAGLTGPPAGAPKPELPPKPLGAGAGEPKPPELPKPPDCGWPNAGAPLENPVAGVCAPPLFAPPSFSYVRPNAAIPKTAPIAI